MTRAVFHGAVIAESDDVRVGEAMTYLPRTTVKPDVLVTDQVAFWHGVETEAS